MNPSQANATTRRNFRPHLLAGIVFLLAAAAAAFLIWQVERHQQKVERIRVDSLTGDHANALQRNIERALSATYALSAMVRQGHGEFPNFAEVAHQMLPLYPGAASLQLAPGGVVQEIVPLAGNEKVIGHDLLSDSLRTKEAFLARDSGELTLAGPFDLVQGGVGAIGRFPVFLDDESGNTFFWGFTSVVIRIPEVFDTVRLPRLAEQGLVYELWRIHPDSGDKQIIAASTSAPLSVPVEQTLELPNDIWTLSVAPVMGWSNPAGLTFMGSLGLLFSLLLAYLAKLLFESKVNQAGLEALVIERTAEIRESEQRLRLLEDNLPDSYVYQYFHEADGTPRFLYLSAGVERLHGVNRQDVLRDAGALLRQIDPEQLLDLAAAEAASLQSLSDFQMELRMRPPDGQWRWFQCRSRSRQKADGQVLWDGVATDITQRKQAEQELQNSRQLLQLILDTLPTRIFWKDRTSNYLGANQAFAQDAGLRSPAELTGKNDLQLVWQEQAERYRADDRLVIETGKAKLNFEEPQTTPDGRTIWLRTSKLPLLEADGKISGVIGTYDDITEQKSHQDQLRHLATHDALTGLANRALLLDRLGQSLHYAHRSGRIVAVLLLDLDRFKVINDSLGHAIGDQLLCVVAQRLRQVVREADTVARMGGDEFVILLAEVAEVEDVGLVAAKVLRILAEPHRLAEREVTLTASLGISLYPKDSDDGATLIRNADMAMYRAKRDERSNFSFYADEMNRHAQETLELENALRKGLECEEFCLHYQPKVDLASGRIIGCEALVRWRHPQRGLVSPADFIPLAEETGLIVPLGTWVLREACRQVKAWQAEGLPTLSVAVNLSARQFHKGDLSALVVEILQEVDLDPRLLELELTESMVMHDPAAAERTMQSLKDLGVSLSLDDFGTGYSSLNYLRRFPVDSLKIDRSFICDVTTDPSGASVVNSVIDIAHNLGLTAVAEGVETIDQLVFLLGCGCDMLQGYLFSKPLPAGAFADLLRDDRRLTIEAA